MKAGRWLVIYQIGLSTLAFIVIISTLVIAESNSNNSFVVVASILPERSIVVDQDLTIQKIYSNTGQDIRPNVYLNGLDGPQVAYGDSIQQQYQDVKRSANFAKPGLVYQRPSGSTQSILRTIVDFFRRLLNL